MKFQRILDILEDFNNAAFNERGLALRLTRYVYLNEKPATPPRTQTQVGLAPVLWSEP